MVPEVDSFLKSFFLIVIVSIILGQDFVFLFFLECNIKVFDFFSSIQFVHKVTDMHQKVKKPINYIIYKVKLSDSELHTPEHSALKSMNFM